LTSKPTHGTEYRSYPNIISSSNICIPVYPTTRVIKRAHVSSAAAARSYK
jgi:hypothetical protein